MKISLVVWHWKVIPTLNYDEKSAFGMSVFFIILENKLLENYLLEAFFKKNYSCMMNF